ncbi:hypothetical protein [Devosia sp.]|uniref:hypothetical protein n=1 Tax=Devosia sp. TaxID=1871048 RepID=UPI003F702BCA
MFDQPASTVTVGGALRCARRMAASMGAHFATLGRRGAYQFAVGQGGLATFSGGIGWRRGFGEALTAQLGFLGGSPFGIAATPAATNSLSLEAQAPRAGQDGPLLRPAVC